LKTYTYIYSYSKKISAHIL